MRREDARGVACPSFSGARQAVMADFDSYIICTSARSGSTLLCKLLSATGIAGNPGSYFHHPSVSAWLDYFGLPPDSGAPEEKLLAAVFKAAIEKGSGGTGLFGLRMQRASFDVFAGKLAVLYPGLPSDTARLRAAFGRVLFIHLSRDDKLAQAVSYVKAAQTGLWHIAPDGRELERLSPAQEPVYDAAAIAAEYEKMTGFDRDWAAWFAAEGIVPLRLSYSQLSAHPQETLGRVLAALGLDPGAAARVQPGVAKLADATNSEWVARFRAERGLDIQQQMLTLPRADDL